MDELAFVSVAFGPAYLEQMDRLEKSIKDFYPNANIIFFRGPSLESKEGFPHGAKTFRESMYGFKPHAIQEAIDKGFDKVVWVDPAMILVDKVDDMFKHPMIAIKDVTPLHNVTSKKAAQYFQTTHYDIEMKQWHLVGGSFYYFNFKDFRVRSIFDLWRQSEIDGIFGSQYEAAFGGIEGHRNDETCMALSMYSYRIFPITHDEGRYNNPDTNPMWIKKHFK